MNSNETRTFLSSKPAPQTVTIVEHTGDKDIESLQLTEGCEKVSKLFSTSQSLLTYHLLYYMYLVIRHLADTQSDFAVKADLSTYTLI